MGTPVEPLYKHELPPIAEDGVTSVYVTPVMDDACAAVSSEQTLTLDDAALLAAGVPVPAPAPALAPVLTAAEGDGADVLAAAAGVFDPFEHAVADMVTSTTLAAAVNTVGNRMTSPSFGRSTVASATER
jgi:hypothetical protein